jgi:diguanylate cyclase (GGDEF)-like protein
MSEVVDHLAELTGFRDRDVLDVTLVGALKDLLRPDAVAIYRCVGEADRRHWLTRARLGAGDTTATADPLWADLATLPALDAHPARHACLLCQQAMAVGSEPALSLFPLATDRDVVGVLEIATARPLEPEQMRLVSSILRVYRNFQGLLDYSERDTLTGLLNRKTFDESFMRSAAGPAVTFNASVPPPGMRRSSADVGTWLGVIDIDHFKRVNDNHGHLIGDEVLLLMARLMRSTFRFNDQLYRFGGEEFVVLMRCDCADDAAHAFERLRGNVERYVFPRVGSITVSVGFTAVRPSDTPSSAFERADKAVYHAKQHGRNQVASHAALVAAGLLAEDTHTGDMELF